MTISIEEFYIHNKVDADFDEVSYLISNPSVVDFYQPHCRDHNICDKHRLYFHYRLYGDKYTNFSISQKNNVNYIQSDNTVKYIYLRPTKGLANRIFNINSFYNFAKTYGFKKIKLCWTSSIGFSEEKFEDLFDVRNIDQELIEFITEDEYGDACNRFLVLDEVVTQDPYTLEYRYLQPEYQIVNHITNQTFCYSWFAAVNYIFEGIVSNERTFIRSLKPSKQIKDRIQSYNIPEDTIGIHIRRGDSMRTEYGYAYGRSTDRSFIQAINSSQTKNFFLATDCANTENKIINSCPDKNIFTHKKKFNSNTLTENDNKPHQSDAVAEIFLLSETKEIYGNDFSTFGMMASQIRTIPFTPITINNYHHISSNNLPPLSLTVGVKNRFQQLKISLQSWLNQDDIKDITIIDWDSKDLDKKYLESLDHRIRVFSFADKKYYHVAKVLNRCIQNAKYDHIIKMDVDYIINPYYQLSQWLELDWDTEFMTGCWTQKMMDNSLGFMEYLHGLMICKRQNITKVNGYNEKLDGYGWEDSELYGRLYESGLIRKVIPNMPNFVPIYHNPHMDFKRTENYKDKDPMLSLNRNRKQCQKEI